MKKLSHPEFASLLQLSIQGLITFGTPKSLWMLEEMLLVLNSQNNNPRLVDLIIQSAELYNQALIVEAENMFGFGFLAWRVVSNCPKCNQIFAIDGTQSGHSDHKNRYHYTVCPMCQHQFDSSCYPIQPLRSIPPAIANAVVGQE